MDSIDGHRVKAVLQDLLDNLSFASYLTPALLSCIASGNHSLSADLRNLFLAHQQAADRLASAAESGTPDDPSLVAPSTRTICRELKQEPLAVLELLQIGEERSPALVFLSAVVKRLLEHMTKRLSTTVEEEASSRQFHAEVARREEKSSKELQSLEQQARVERRDRSRALLQLAEQERRARDELAAVRGQTVSVAERLADEYRAAEEADRARFAEREASLAAEAAAMTAELTRAQTEAREAEAALRSKKRSSEKEVRDWLQQYDADMAARDTTLRAQKAEYRDVKAKLRGFHAHYQRLQEEEEARAAAARLAAETKAALEADQRRINSAAAKIQHAWRAFRKGKAASEGKSTLKKGKTMKATAKDVKGMDKSGKKPDKPKSSQGKRK